MSTQPAPAPPGAQAPGAVTLRFAPRPVHVRAARLVAVAVARRTGAFEEDLDEVRLAVGEVCARAVRRCLEPAAAGADAPHHVELSITDDAGLLTVVVTDGAGQVALDDEDVSLALVRGLADSVEVASAPQGPEGAVRLVWDWRSPTSHGGVSSAEG